tara:strand:+ start:1652 stop:1795 length:144 start_codon:yes stop_codon:yes gene_type:complete
MTKKELNKIPVTYEEVNPYQNGTKRKTFNFNDWINNVVFKTENNGDL